MSFIAESLLLAVSLFAVMVALQEWGRRLGERDRRLEPDAEKAGKGAAEGAVYGLLGLFLAFTFSGAGGRFDERRHLIVEEAAAIGTAWQRLDVLPAQSRGELQGLFRQYLDTRLALTRVRDGDELATGMTRVAALQDGIWSAAATAANTSERIVPSTVLLPALNEMFDSALRRNEAARRHPPLVVFVVLVLLALVGAVFAGYGMAGRRTRNWIHVFGFAAAVTLAVYVSIELEFPRLGLVRLDAADQVLVDVRHAMD